MSYLCGAMKEKSVSIITLGCKLNFSESSSIGRSFASAGYTLKNDASKADVFIINTCAVTASAEKKCRTAIRRARKDNPRAVIAAVGCMCQLRADSLAAMPEIDIILGSSEKYDAAEAIEDFSKTRQPQLGISDILKSEQFTATYSSGDRTRSFLKIQDGCDHFCNYCTIPYARGRSRSDSIQNSIRLAYEIVERGAKEIVLTGVNIGEFGKYSGESLHELLLRLHEVKGLERLRISSIEPELLSTKIIKLASESELIMPHFHIPLQAGSNKVLKDMKRPYLREKFKDLLIEIFDLMPLACVAADIIAGYPTENAEDFEDALAFVERLNISYLHVFPFSPRPGTPAARLKAVYAPGEIKKRTNSLLEISLRKEKAFYTKNLERTAKVLFESSVHQGKISGLTENYLEVISPYNQSYINSVISVKLDYLNENGKFEILTV